MEEEEHEEEESDTSEHKIKKKHYPEITTGLKTGGLYNI